MTLQTSDYACEEQTDVSFEAALEQLTSFDWATELRAQAEALATGGDACPPGMLLADEDERILHLMPAEDGLTDVAYWRPVRRKLLGLIPLRYSKDLWFADVPRDQWAELLRAHYDRDHERLLALLERLGRRK